MSVTVGTVVDQTSLDTGYNSIQLIVAINHYHKNTVTLGGFKNTGIVLPWPLNEGGNEINVNQTITCFVTAQVVEAGSLLTIEGAGGLPVSYNNILLAENAVIIDADALA